MPDERNRIEVFAEHEEDQAATGVHFPKSIEGSSFFTGRAAFSKAKELAALYSLRRQPCRAAGRMRSRRDVHAGRMLQPLQQFRSLSGAPGYGPLRFQSVAKMCSVTAG
jgi:hypothetical protein